jgi:hypothetical protein
MTTETRADPIDARDKRALTLSIVVGVVLGALLGATRYGFFSMGNVACMGLGLIVVVSLHAAVIATLPRRE